MAQNLNRLLGLAGESLVESRWLRPHSVAVARMKRLHMGIAAALDQLRAGLGGGMSPERLAEILADAQRQLLHAREFMARRVEELEAFDRRSSNLAHRLYDEALQVRMRPVGDGVGGLARMVRDVAWQLGKEVRFQVIREKTQVDRDIVDKLEAPLGHLLRNALDHGLETPAERAAAGKPAAGTLKREARHRAGKLIVTVTDDGRGPDLERLRLAVVEKKLVMPEMAPRLRGGELLEFLFLPGFSVKEQVSEISGRGVGLDVVQSMKAVRGTVRVQSTAGQGMRFTLQLPLTLSVVRALLAEIGGEPYAFPLGFITRTLRVEREAVASTEGRQHFEFDGQRIALWGEDQGPGIPEKERGKLFKDFGRLSNLPTGGESSTGLGLAICRKIVEAHRGTIVAENLAERGCEFRVMLPG